MARGRQQREGCKHSTAAQCLPLCASGRGCIALLCKGMLGLAVLLGCLAARESLRESQLQAPALGDLTSLSAYMVVTRQCRLAFAAQHLCVQVVGSSSGIWWQLGAASRDVSVNRMQAAEFWELGLEPLAVSAISGSGTGEMMERLAQVCGAHASNTFRMTTCC
jgi:hypothetical protein